MSRAEPSFRLSAGARLSVSAISGKRYPLFSQAVRTLSPEVIVIDEIGSRREAEAILAVAGCGVPLIATTHARGAREAALRPAILPLLRAGVFSLMLGLRREGGAVLCTPCYPPYY